MEYMGNEAYWDQKFANRGDQPLSPEQALIDHISCFKRGSVLDIACGDGRNALFLLQRGFKVTGVDFSQKALDRLSKFAQRNHFTVNTKQIDLSVSDSLKDIGLFDNIVINHYRLNKDQLGRIHEHISENGILFVSGFGDQHTGDSDIKGDDLIRASDFNDVKACFELIQYKEERNDRGFFVTYIFRKK